MSRNSWGPATRAILVGCLVAVVHQIALLVAWTQWNAIPRPGHPVSMPWQWPILAFPLFPLYDLLSGHDRTMWNSFWWVMLGNSVVWGIAAAILTRLWFKRRG
jgi:hypothetical protein